MGRRPVCTLCLLLIVFLWFSDWMGIPLIRGNPLPDEMKSWLEKQSEVSAIGEVERSADTEFSQSVYLKNVSVLYKSKKVSIGNTRVFLRKKEKLPAGSLICVSGILEEIGGPRNPGEFNSKQFYACRHTYYLIKKAVIKKKSRGYSRYGQFMLEFKERLGTGIDHAAREASPVFRAMTLGDKEELEDETRIRYQMGGIIHILAISGLHISILGVGLYGLLKRAGMGIWGAGMAALFVMIQYGAMTGGSVSSMRAVIMFLLGVGARILGRIYDMPTAISVAGILILMESPAYILESGFWMSFGAVLGIGVIAPVFIDLAGVKGKLSKAFISSAAVQLTSFPIMLWFYGEVSLVGIFLNLLVLPTAGIVLGSGVLTALVGLGWNKGAVMCAIPGRILLFLYEKLCMCSEKIPFGTWVAGRQEQWQTAVYYGLLLAVLLGWKSWERGRGEKASHSPGSLRKWRLGVLAVICVGIFIVTGRPKHGFRITCLDIGQGDSIVIETPERQIFLMDGGSSNKKKIGQYQILPYLKSRGITAVDAAFVSHTDEDHISGIRELLELQLHGLTSIKIRCLVLPRWERPPEKWKELKSLAKRLGIPVRTGGRGSCFEAGRTKMRILSPAYGALGENVNEESLVAEISYEGFLALFTGDMGEETERRLLKEGTLKDVDYLKVGHHGSRYSSCERFLEKVKPEVGVISASESNTYGHPSPETIKRLQAEGAKVWCTKDCGAVTVEVEEGMMRVTAFCRSQ